MGKQTVAKEREWQEAKRRFGLSTRHVDMARALGLNPRKLGNLSASPSQAWKIPLPSFIEELYRERFGEVAEP